MHGHTLNQTHTHNGHVLWMKVETVESDEVVYCWQLTQV